LKFEKVDKKKAVGAQETPINARIGLPCLYTGICFNQNYECNSGLCCDFVLLILHEANLVKGSQES
jgi:hypothetical protein